MIDLPHYAAALRPQLAGLTSRAIEALSDRVLGQLDSPERAMCALVESVLDSLHQATPGPVADWARGATSLYDPSLLGEMASAATFAVCSGSQELDAHPRELLAFCERLTGAIAEAVAVTAALTDQEPDSEGFVAIMAALHARDVQTCAHAHATGMWARRLATAMGLPKAQVEVAEYAAVLHDVGKIATPDAILLKPGPLDEDEWAVMRMHAVEGEKILARIPSLAKYAPIVRAHHERFDGMGYPDGLRGYEIPFEARLLSVVDSFHAMISKRPYRDALPHRVALQVLRGGRGSQWDAAIVDAMLVLVERGDAIASRRIARKGG